MTFGDQAIVTDIATASSPKTTEDTIIDPYTLNCKKNCEAILSIHVFFLLRVKVDVKSPARSTNIFHVIQKLKTVSQNI